MLLKKRKKMNLLNNWFHYNCKKRLEKEKASNDQLRENFLDIQRQLDSVQKTFNIERNDLISRVEEQKAIYHYKISEFETKIEELEKEIDHLTEKNKYYLKQIHQNPNPEIKRKKKASDVALAKSDRKAKSKRIVKIDMIK